MDIQNVTLKTVDKVIEVFLEQKILLQKEFIRKKTELHLYQVDGVLEWLLKYNIIVIEETNAGNYYKWIGEFNGSL